MARFNQNTRKLTNLILFIARQCEGDRTFGSVKLNKILFYADFAAFRTLGAPITGARYQHLPEGPALAAMVPVIRDMTAGGKAREIQGTEGPKHRRLVALVDPDIGLFSAAEIALVTEYITKFWGVSAAEVSLFSHDTMAWRLTDDLQEIPYGTAFLSFVTPTDEDVVWLKEIARELVGTQPN